MPAIPASNRAAGAAISPREPAVAVDATEVAPEPKRAAAPRRTEAARTPRRSVGAAAPPEVIAAAAILTAATPARTAAAPAPPSEAPAIQGRVSAAQPAPSRASGVPASGEAPRGKEPAAPRTSRAASTTAPATPDPTTNFNPTTNAAATSTPATTTTATPTTSATPAPGVALPPAVERALEQAQGVVLAAGAHLRVEGGPSGDLELHLRVRGGVADVRVEGDAAPALAARDTELSRALSAEGLALGRLDVEPRAAASGETAPPSHADPGAADAQQSGSGGMGSDAHGQRPEPGSDAPVRREPPRQNRRPSRAGIDVEA